ncbi:MAG: ATP-grasp domain-containing protein [Ignavibacteriales bacterium]|nr:MAG: ATP-grasp domain-containing protein [Ignavibacteriales bacterium]
MKTDKKILICYNSPASIFPVYNGKPLELLQVEDNLPINDLSETGFTQNINSIKKILQKFFVSVETLAVDRNVQRIVSRINKFSPDAIFNFVESVEGISSYEYCTAGLFELMGFDYTGNTPFCLGNCLNKERTKNILRSFKIRTPKSRILNSLRKTAGFNRFDLKFPVILKLLNEDASIGISEFSVVNNPDELKKHFEFLYETYKQDIIAEEYIEGRELNVAVLGDTALPVSEIDFTGLPENLPKIVTYDGKWIAESVYYANTKPKCPAELDKKLKKKITSLALEAFHALSCRDYARVDIRINKNGRPYVIEVNPNPDISEDSGFARAAAAKGINYPDLLFTIAGFAINRRKNDTKSQAV